MPKSMKFTEDYYENGLETGVSCYENYRWLPELTIPMAMTIIDFLGIKRHQSILDFGCAKGYLVKAFRLLAREAYGVDISEYAIDNCDPDVKDHLYFGGAYLHAKKDFVIAKDVFEHITLEDLKDELEWIGKITKNLFVIVPLGDNGHYRSPKNNLDVTHLICDNELWWIRFFEDNNWDVKGFRFRMKGIKDGYYKSTPKAHGFFVLEGKR